MTEPIYGKSYAGKAPENYEKYFVPFIGGPIAEGLIEAAALKRGERVLDVACGTGVVTRLAAERVGDEGSVAGLDINPGMLAVARSVAAPSLGIDWYESNAEAIPLSDDAFDVVLCQMGLQFMSNKLAALREIRRILAPTGRLVLNLPGPTPQPLAIMADALSRHVAPKCASFVHIVFSLHEADELKQLASKAGFSEVSVSTTVQTLQLPPPEEFLWQYIYCTPLAAAVDEVEEETRKALQEDVCALWEDFVVDGGLQVKVPITTVIGSG